MCGPFPASTSGPTYGARPVHPLPLTYPPSRRSDWGREGGDRETKEERREREEQVVRNRKTKREFVKAPAEFQLSVCLLL